MMMEGYKYYMEVHSNEHMLNAYEIACKYNIYSTKDKPHARLVARMLSERQKETDAPKIYYRTSRGDMMRVFGAYEYESIMKELIEKYEPNVEHCLVFSNKNHYFIIKQ
jgi:hypothetical protein